MYNNKKSRKDNTKSNNEKFIIKTERNQKRSKFKLPSKSSNNKHLNNKRYNNYLTNFSNEFIQDAISNKDEEKYNNMNDRNHLNNSKNLISNFIIKNNFLADEIDKEQNSGNLPFDNFLNRENMFLNKLNSDKDRMQRNINDEFLSKMKDKPTIDENSRKIMEKKIKIERNKIKNFSHKNNDLNKLINSEENNFNLLKNDNNNRFEKQTTINDNEKEIKKNNNSSKKNWRKKNLEINNLDFESNKIKRANSENNIKIRKIKGEPINKFIKISESSNFLYMNRIKEKSNFDKLIKFQIISPSTKIKKIEINKINEEIDNLCTKEIDFYSFCELLFHFGFINIKHKKEYIMKYNEVDKNNDIIDNLLIRNYFDENLITKEFVFNEINIIKKAFKSIHEKFSIQKYEPINIGIEYNLENKLSDINYTIPIKDFKFFIFIMKNLFAGLNKEDINNLTEKEKYIKKNYINDEEKINDNFKKETEFKNDKMLIYDLIKRITSIKNIKKFTSDFINDFKNCFSYMIETYEKFKYFSDIQHKEIKNKIKNKYKNYLKEFTFKPKINKTEKNKKFKDNKDYNLSNNKNKSNKNKISNLYNFETSKLYSFRPKIQRCNLKKLFRDSNYKTNSQKESGKKDLNNHCYLQKNKEKSKNKNQINKKFKGSEGDSRLKNSIYNLLKNENYDCDINRKNNIKSYNEENKNKLNIVKNYKDNNNINSQNEQKTKIKSLIFLEVKGAKTKHLIIEPENDYKEVIKNFCLENGFDSSKYMILLKAVKNKINQKIE